MSTPAAPSVLFLCVRNAGRSQMAAAFLTHLAGDKVQVRSAGSVDDLPCQVQRVEVKQSARQLTKRSVVVCWMVERDGRTVDVTPRTGRLRTAAAPRPA